MTVPGSKIAPRLTWRVPRNAKSAPKNNSVIPGSAFAPRKDTTVPRNAEMVLKKYFRGPRSIWSRFGEGMVATSTCL
jgi:hypothetical protein